MICEKGGATHIYRVGDQMVGNRELVEIHETHVMLRNEERVERLRIRGRSSQWKGGAGERNRTVISSLGSWGNNHYTTPALLARWWRDRL